MCDTFDVNRHFVFQGQKGFQNAQISENNVLLNKIQFLKMFTLCFSIYKIIVPFL